MVIITKDYASCAELVDVDYSGMTFEFERWIWNVRKLEMLKFGNGYGAA
jgi:hypothetical protein